MDETIFLKEWRVFARLKQEQLAYRLGITGAQVSRIETGKRDFDGRYLKVFSAAINEYLQEVPRGAPYGHVRIRHFADPLRFPPEAFILNFLDGEWATLKEKIANNLDSLPPVTGDPPTKLR